MAALALRRQLYSWRRWSSSGTRVEDTFLARRQLSYVSWRAFLAALSRAKNQTSGKPPRQTSPFLLCDSVPTPTRRPENDGARRRRFRRRPKTRHPASALLVSPVVRNRTNGALCVESLHSAALSAYRCEFLAPRERQTEPRPQRPHKRPHKSAQAQEDKRRQKRCHPRQTNQS